ncbi:sensor histidine kinase [Falsiroseomonas sp. HW251]|uniref:sensor histidine kinase n=1 Tax=Falsiroseomonas sp. HW251 TaxID=3390998 RepID=UPI003D311773
MDTRSDLFVDAQTLRARLRQQRLVAAFGAEALRNADFDDLLQEAARVASEGLGVELAKVLEYIPREDALLIRAGVGWRDGTVSVVKLGADTASPAGFALKTGEPVISNHLAGEARFRTPQIIAEHGVRRAVNVIVQGESDGPPFGVLEADSRDEAETFSPDDIAFLQALANTLGLAADRERDRLARDLLMREIHHRVKNSLQIAQTVLLLQAKAAGAEAAKEPLEEAARRILSIAAVHERLYAGPEVGRVDLRLYLSGLVEDLTASAGATEAGRSISLEVAPDADGATCDADRATTIGLVATELVTNALKYGAGEVIVRLVLSDNETKLIVEDEGAGPSADFDPRASRGLGMRLLTGLLRGGGLEVDRKEASSRTRFVAIMPVVAGSSDGSF